MPILSSLMLGSTNKRLNTYFLERSSLHEGRAEDLFHRKWNVTMNTVTVTIEPLPVHTRSSLTVCPCVRTHFRCRYAWVALSRSFLRCRYAWVSLSRSYLRWTNIPEARWRVSAMKEKPSILSHTSTEIWHRFKFQRPMFTNWHMTPVQISTTHVYDLLTSTFCISQHFESVYAHLIFFSN